MKRRITILLAAIAFAFGASSATAFADAGGGPGSNHGCAGHQTPPPPDGGCGK